MDFLSTKSIVFPDYMSNNIPILIRFTLSKSEIYHQRIDFPKNLKIKLFTHNNVHKWNYIRKNNANSKAVDLLELSMISIDLLDVTAKTFIPRMSLLFIATGLLTTDLCNPMVWFNVKLCNKSHITILYTDLYQISIFKE